MAVTPRKIAQTLAACRRAARRYDCPLPVVLGRFWRLYGRELYSPNEIFLWGLLDTKLSDDDLAGYVSNERLHELQAAFNAKAEDYRVEDKVAFHEIAARCGLAVPSLYGVFAPSGGWCGEARELVGQAPWTEALERLPHDEFVIKPSQGFYGQEVRIFVRRAGGLVDFHGQPWDPAEIYRLMAGGTGYDTFVIEERLRNDPEIAQLCATETLQTLRLVTLIQDPQAPQAEILFALWKLSTGNVEVDNFNLGRSGNLCADVNLEQGTLGKVVTGAPDGLGLVEVVHQPRTEQPLAGFRLPHWEEAQALVRRAALEVMPLRTVGWDVGLTAAGPVIVEGNAWWGPFHNAHGQMGRYLSFHDGRRP
ncbi:MAG: sugar-transfer associated ATP-grasp domain-containing protein [Pseudomonadota bacterium]